ncbi:MAG: pyridoxamine 5'-phosphate oxidase family protein [Nocardioidaceae bacterium]
MSVKVDLTRLGETMGDYDFAYLLTVSDDARAHAVAVQPRLEDQALRVTGLGNRTRANLSARDAVTLLFPPREQGGYSLIVDGRATAHDDGASVVPSHAVLHRPAEHPTAPADGTCGNDCVPLEG